MAHSSSCDPTSLPADADNQTFVTVKALLTCTIHLPHCLVFQDCINCSVAEGTWVPVFNFMIEHPRYGKSLFDLGIRKQGEGYPPSVMPRVRASHATECKKDTATLLREAGIQPEVIKTVFISHLHWDHIGNPGLFTAAEIVLGPEAKALLANDVYPANPKGTIAQFASDSLMTFVDFTNASAQSSTILPHGTFRRAVDYYGDGSFYLVDTPGHLPGHMSSLARIAPNTFAFLGGDICHNRQCYFPGKRLISESAHRDISAARESVKSLAALAENAPNAVVILAHEAERLEEGMPLFPLDIRDWALRLVKKRREATNISSKL